MHVRKNYIKYKTICTDFVYPVLRYDITANYPALASKSVVELRNIGWICKR